MGWAQQAMLTGDSQINSAATTTKYGASTTLNINPTNSALLQFDLTDMLPSGTTAAQVLKARLIVFPDAITTGGTVNLYQVTSAWSEGTVTYATKPTIAGTAAATLSVGVNNAFHDFGVTALVQSWITTPASNFGVELQASGTTNITIDSKENTNTSHPAVLEIDLSGRPAPLALLARKVRLARLGQGATGRDRGNRRHRPRWNPDAAVHRRNIRRRARPLFNIVNDCRGRYLGDRQQGAF